MEFDKVYYRRNHDGTLFLIVNRAGVASLRKVTGMSKEVSLRFEDCKYEWRINKYNTPLGLSIFEEMDETSWIEIPEGFTINMVRLSSAPHVRISDCFVPIK